MRTVHMETETHFVYQRPFHIRDMKFQRLPFSFSQFLLHALVNLTAAGIPYIQTHLSSL